MEKLSVMWKRIFCVLLTGSMLFVIGCGNSTQSDSGDRAAASQSAGGIGGLRMGGQEATGEKTTGVQNSVAENTEGATEQSVQDLEGEDAGTTGTEFEYVEGVNTEQKLIKTVNMSAETTEFDTLVADVRTRTESAGGYVESSDIGGNYGGDMTRYAYLVLWIPAENLNDFVDGVKDTSHVQSFSENTEDVTLQYTDMDTHIKALREELDALFSMMEQATSMKDILAIQSQITEVRYEIESYESQLRVYDNQITYSTVHLDLYEVSRESSTVGTTFGERVKAKFNDNVYQMGQGFQNFMVGLLGGLPILIPVVVICAVAALLLRRFWKKRKRRKE